MFFEKISYCYIVLLDSGWFGALNFVLKSCCFFPQGFPLLFRPSMAPLQFFRGGFHSKKKPKQAAKGA